MVSITSKLNMTCKAHCELTLLLPNLILRHSLASSYCLSPSEICNCYLQLRKCISSLTLVPVYMCSQCYPHTSLSLANSDVYSTQDQLLPSCHHRSLSVSPPRDSPKLICIVLSLWASRI